MVLTNKHQDGKIIELITENNECGMVSCRIRYLKPLLYLIPLKLEIITTLYGNANHHAQNIALYHYTVLLHLS